MKRSRLNVYLERAHEIRLTELAAAKRASKSSIIATALYAYLSPEGNERRTTATAKRIERLSVQFERLERDQAILIETLALFIRHHLSITPAVPESHQDAARAQGRARFNQFIEQLARHLQRGDSLIRDVFREVAPEQHAHASNQPQAPTAPEMPS